MGGVDCPKLLLEDGEVAVVEEVVLGQGGVHFEGPGVGVPSSAVGPVGDVPLLKLLHDGLVE